MKRKEIENKRSVLYKTMNHQLLLIAVAILTLCVIGCDTREPEVFYNHGFTIDIFTKESALLLQETPLSIQMNPNQWVYNTQYTMEYRVVKGEGTLMTLNDSVVTKAAPFIMTTDSINYTQKFRFIPQSEGEVTLAMRIADNHGSDQEFEVKYQIKNPPFTVSITPEQTQVFEETTTNITIDLVQQEVTEMQYQIKLNTLSDLGNITNASGTVFKADQWYPITLGENSFTFTAIKSGDYPLSITIKDEFDQEITSRLPLTIKNVSFDASLTAVATELYETQSTALNLSITQENPATITYKAKLNTVSTIATLTLPDGTTMQSDVWYDVALGDNNLQLQALQPGTYTVDITVLDSDGKELPKSLDITINGVVFDLEATASKTSIFETGTTTINLNLSQDMPDISLAYEVQLNTVSTVGNIKFANGSAMYPNQWYDLSLGDTGLRFESLVTGVYNAEFTVRVKGQPERTIDVSKVITVRQTEFELEPDPYVTQINTMNNDGKFQIGESLITRFLPKLIGLRKDLTYTLRFTSTISGILRTCSGCANILPNTEMPLNSNAFVNEQPFFFHYLSQNNGNHTITFTVTASNGFSKSVSVNVYVHKIPTVDNVTTGMVCSGGYCRYYIRTFTSLDPSISQRRLDKLDYIDIRYTTNDGRERSFRVDY